MFDNGIYNIIGQLIGIRDDQNAFAGIILEIIRCDRFPIDRTHIQDYRSSVGSVRSSSCITQMDLVAAFEMRDDKITGVICQIRLEVGVSRVLIVIGGKVCLSVV